MQKIQVTNSKIAYLRTKRQNKNQKQLANYDYNPR